MCDIFTGPNFSSSLTTTDGAVVAAGERLRYLRCELRKERLRLADAVFWTPSCANVEVLDLRLQRGLLTAGLRLASRCVRLRQLHLHSRGQIHCVTDLRVVQPLQMPTLERVSVDVATCADGATLVALLRIVARPPELRHLALRSHGITFDAPQLDDIIHPARPLVSLELHLSGNADVSLAHGRLRRGYKAARRRRLRRPPTCP